jgi:succinate dehydrogenase / fumarate reductase flavoprotein subunit
MQGLADGYFVIPYTIGHYLATAKQAKPGPDRAEFKKAESDVTVRLRQLLAINGRRTTASFHRELGHLLWEECGMARSESGLRKALAKIPELRAEFWKNLKVAGEPASLNQDLEYAGRVADFLEFGELLCADALHRNESCGGHFRVEHQFEDGEAKRDDARYAYVGAWEYAGEGRPPVLHQEPLVYEEVKMSTRSYK